MNTATKCHFCGAADNLLACCWPVVKFVPVQLRNLAAGDRVHRAKEQHTQRPPAIVMEIEPVFSIVSNEIYWVKVSIQLPGPAKRERRFSGGPTSWILAERPGSCRQVACELCRAERGAGIHCREHWHAWQSVA